MDSKEQALFTEKLNEIRETAVLQGNSVTTEQIKETFSELNFNDAQFELVVNYLKGFHIGVDEEGDIEAAFTTEDRDFLEMYLSEIDELEPVSDGRKQALLIGAAAGDKSVKDALISAFLPQVVELSKMYAGQGALIEDLIGEGNVALAVCMDMLEGAQSAEAAEDLIMHSIMEAMENLIYEDNREKLAFDDWAEEANEVMDKAHELYEIYQRKVTVDELCRDGGFEKDFVMDVINVTGGKIEYIESAPGKTTES